MKKIFTRIFTKIFTFTRTYSRIKDILEAKRLEKEKIPSIKMAMLTGSIKRVK